LRLEIDLSRFYHVFIAVEIVVFRAEKLKTDFQRLKPTWEQRKN